MSLANLPDDVVVEITNEIKSHRKLAAIKLYKDATGLSLLESKKAIEDFTNEILRRSADSKDASTEKAADFHDKILDAIFKGQKIEAIKLYKDGAGVSLREAKEFVENLTDQLQDDARDQFEPAQSGCFTLVVFAFILGSLLALLQTYV